MSAWVRTPYPGLPSGQCHTGRFSQVGVPLAVVQETERHLGLQRRRVQDRELLHVLWISTFLVSEGGAQMIQINTELQSEQWGHQNLLYVSIQSTKININSYFDDRNSIILTVSGLC